MSVVDRKGEDGQGYCTSIGFVVGYGACAGILYMVGWHFEGGRVGFSLKRFVGLFDFFVGYVTLCHIA